MQDIDAASQLVLDRQYQKPPQPQQRQRGQAPPSGAPPPAGWQQQYVAPAGPAEEEDEEESDDAINLATLLNILDGSEPTPSTSQSYSHTCAPDVCLLLLI